MNHHIQEQPKSKDTTYQKRQLLYFMEDHIMVKRCIGQIQLTMIVTKLLEIQIELKVSKSGKTRE